VFGANPLRTLIVKSQQVMSQVSASDLSVTSGSGSAIRPTRYNGKTSFSAWKLKTLAYLQSLGLKDVVVNNPQLFQESETKGAVVDVDVSPATENDYVHVKTKKKLKAGMVHDSVGVNGSSRSVLLKKSDKAYSILLNLLDDDLTDLVATVEQGNAFRVWAILLETYETKSTASVCHRLDLLMNIQFKPEAESFDVFKARLIKLVKELEDRGESVSPTIQRYVLLRSLPAKYEALVQSLKINDTITIEEVYVHIKDYCEADQRRMGAGTRERGGASAPAPGEHAHIGREAKRKKFRCFRCGSRKHMIRECPKRNRERNSRSDSESDSDGDTERKSIHRYHLRNRAENEA